MFGVLRSLLALRVSGRRHPGFGSRPRGPSWPLAVGGFFLLLGLLPLAGCGKGSNLPALAPVKGKVTVNGQPVTSGQVVLSPEKPEQGKQAGFSTGPIDSSGNYEITTDGQSGAPLGPAKLVVTLNTMPQPGGKPKADFNPKYSDPARSPLRFTVVEKAAPGTYDLKLVK